MKPPLEPTFATTDPERDPAIAKLVETATRGAESLHVATDLRLGRLLLLLGHDPASRDFARLARRFGVTVEELARAQQRSADQLDAVAIAFDPPQPEPAR